MKMVQRWYIYILFTCVCVCVLCACAIVVSFFMETCKLTYLKWKELCNVL